MKAVGQGQAGQQAHLAIRSCGVAPCRPCLPSGRPSLDPLGTERSTETAAERPSLKELPLWGLLPHTLKAEHWTVQVVSTCWLLRIRLWP